MRVEIRNHLTDVSSPRTRKLARCAVLAAVAWCSSAAPARALVPGDLCTGNPCVVGTDVVIDADAALDFGVTTDLRFAPGVRVLLQNGSTAAFSAGSIVIGSGARFSSDAPGSSLYFSADATTIEIGVGGAPASFVLRDGVEVGFFAEGDCTVNARADVSGSQQEGGVFYIQSFGDVLFRGNVVADGSRDGQYNAGAVDFDADGSLVVDGKLRARGYGPDSGYVLMRGAEVHLMGGIDVKPKVGYGGTVEVSAAAADVTLDAKIDAGGRRAPDDAGGNNCGGGIIQLMAAQSIALNAKASVRGGGPGGCSGGSFTAQAGANFVWREAGRSGPRRPGSSASAAA
ncbi:MAG: hypothetical protein AB1689_21480 [Thermodesulfobacteriota bacterium]